MLIKKLSGWGNNFSQLCKIFPVSCNEALADFGKINGHLPHARGGGTSYGDASLNKNGLVVEMRNLPKLLELDADLGIVKCSAGLTLYELLREGVKRGWFFHSTPGTSNATIGGCIACDAHGKNWGAGAFGNHLLDFSLLLPNGEVKLCSQLNNKDLFFSTIGGMGLTGIILEATLKLKRIPSPLMCVETIKFSNLNECIKLQEESKLNYEYIYCWLDSLSDGEDLGRGILQRANHFDSAEHFNIGIKNHKPRFNVPFMPPINLINRLSVACFNLAYYYLTRPTKKKQNLFSFFYPLDNIANWNRLYGKKGFIEYQAAIPQKDAIFVLSKILEITASSKLGSFMLGIKPLGNSTGILSFASTGYTIAIDFASSAKVKNLIKQIDEIVIAHKGRVYLSKDSTLAPEDFKSMYSDRLVKFKEVLLQNGLLDSQTSSLWKRLFL
jgi:FAD/FMN-containing dehydrogenase